jgi:hypothetical protein
LFAFIGETLRYASNFVAQSGLRKISLFLSQAPFDPHLAPRTAAIFQRLLAVSLQQVSEREVVGVLKVVVRAVVRVPQADA